MNKPLTKALHTRRVVYQVARYLCATEKWALGVPPRNLLVTVLVILGNAEPESLPLLGELVLACESAQNERRQVAS